MGKWTNQGFVANTLSYYKSAIQQVFIEAFGDDFDLNDNLPQGVLIQRLAELFYGMDMDGVEAFARLNLNTMGGVFLDVVGNLRGVPRVLGQPQTGLATITCQSASFSPFTLPEGTVLTVTETGDTFVVSRVTTLESDTMNVDIAFTENGNSSAIVGNTMTVEGFPQIQNIEIVSLFDGTENESDIAYRSRLQREYPAAVGTIEYVNNLLRALPTVKAVGCLYNDTSSSVGGIPAYCTEWLVAPAQEVTIEALDAFKSAVGEVIVDNKVPGSPTYGNTTVTVADAFGTSKTVKFTVAREVPIEISVTVATPEDTGVFDLGSVADDKETVWKYVNNLEIGKDVSFSRCIAPFASDKGFDVIAFKMRTVASLKGDDTHTYVRNPMYDTSTAMGWEYDSTIYWTQGTVFPVPGAGIFSDEECTTQITFVDSLVESEWIENDNLVIEGRQFASISINDINVGI